MAQVNAPRSGRSTGARADQPHQQQREQHADCRPLGPRASSTGTMPTAGML